MIRSTCMLLALLLSPACPAAEHEQRARATYLANSGVLVEHGDRKVLFDPLFRLAHSYYRSLPEAMENDLLVAEPPFDGVDAVLVTHIHLDHFSPNLLLDYLMINSEVRLFAPEQAVIAMRRFTTEDDAGLMGRVVSLNLSQYGKPVRHELDGIVVETVRVPHAGWPERERGTQNLVYRVTLNGTTTVLHLGDAATQPDLFERFDEHWRARELDMLLTPYWFFLEDEGRRIIYALLKPMEAVGVHVPANVPVEPNRRTDELQELDLFTRPGEIRAIGGG